ncbi:MAG: cation-transporting P-type ATPase, partial [Candidatus Hodarchaeota archaeon]
MHLVQSGFYHTLDISEVENNFNTSIERGLSQEEARDRLERFGPNVLEEAKRITPFQMFI